MKNNCSFRGLVVMLAFVLSAAEGRCGLSAEQVSFMDFGTVNVEAVIAQIGATDYPTLFTLRRFAVFEAMHNSRGAADRARRIAAAIDASPVMRSRGAPAAPTNTVQPSIAVKPSINVKPSRTDAMKSFLKLRPGPTERLR